MKKSILLLTALIALLPSCRGNNKTGAENQSDGSKAVEAAEVRTESEQFIDFEGVTPEGKTVRLSDYVGKGNYALVDFWASWCGPCRREMPNIKDIYNTWAPKGLTVVSVAVWDGDNSKSREAIREIGMDWNQIFTGDITTPTDLYGIEAIPHIIVFGPDGKILARELRGQDLKDYIKNLYK